MKHIFMATGQKYSFPAISLDVVCKPVPKSDWPVMQHRLAHLRDLPLTKSGGRIDLLVGLDLSALMVPTETRRAQTSGTRWPCHGNKASLSSVATG